MSYKLITRTLPRKRGGKIQPKRYGNRHEVCAIHGVRVCERDPWHDWNNYTFCPQCFKPFELTDTEHLAKLRKKRERRGQTKPR